MKMAIAEAKQARILDEVPIGVRCVSVRWTGVIGIGRICVKSFQDVTYHAEMLAMKWKHARI